MGCPNPLAWSSTRHPWSSSSSQETSPKRDHGRRHSRVGGQRSAGHRWVALLSYSGAPAPLLAWACQAPGSRALPAPTATAPGPLRHARLDGGHFLHQRWHHHNHPWGRVRGRRSLVGTALTTSTALGNGAALLRHIGHCSSRPGRKRRAFRQLWWSCPSKEARRGDRSRLGRRDRALEEVWVCFKASAIVKGRHPCPPPTMLLIAGRRLGNAVHQDDEWRRLVSVVTQESLPSRGPI